MKKIGYVILIAVLMVLGALVLMPIADAAAPAAPVDFWTQFKNTIDGPKIAIIIGLIGTNFILGVAVALKNHKFNLKELGMFIGTKVAPLVGGYLAVGIIAALDASWQWAVLAAWAAVIATLSGAILQNLKDLGIPVPPALRDGTA